MHFYHRFVGSAVSVLFEARNTQGLFTGLTGNYIRVGVTSDEDLSNQIRIVRVHGVMDGLALGTAVSGASALRESLTE